MEREWTQADCANHFGVLKDSYQKWEWNQITPVIYRRKIVCNFLEYNYWDDGTKSLANLSLLYRIEHKLTQMELGKLFRISPRTIERIEAKEKHVSYEMKQKVLTILNKIST